MVIKKINFITGHDSLEVDNYYLGLTPGKKGIVGNYQFFFNQDLKSYDYLVVFEKLLKPVEASIPLKNTIFVAGEATSIKRYKNKFLLQFGHVITCQQALEHSSKYLKSPGHTWFSKKTYDDLANTAEVKKTKLLSIVVSNKEITMGHRKRLQFCLELKRRLGDKVDLFGRGFNQFDDKWEAIAPYKYSIAIENSVEEHWVTEKIGDCFTSHTFPFYIGAPNIRDYYDPKSFSLIDFNDFEGSIEKILSIINDDDHYDNHLKYLQKAKYDYINNHSILPMVCTFIDNEINKGESHSESAVLRLVPEQGPAYKAWLRISKLIERVKIFLTALIGR